MGRLSALPLPRFVSPASVSEGDTIRVTWNVGDVEHTRTGKVARIERRFGWVFITPDGHEIAHVMRDNRTRTRVTLLAEAKQESTPLFEMG